MPFFWHGVPFALMESQSCFVWVTVPSISEMLFVTYKISKTSIHKILYTGKITRMQLKAGFHLQRSRSRNRRRSRKRAYNLVKIENRSREQSHKLD